jgi:N-carbamoyl-L-amino-acid hydrolase
VEVRALSEQSVERASDAIGAAARAAADEFRCRATVEPGLVIQPVRMDPGFVAAMVEVCERTGRPWRKMTSGAGHDAGALAARMPVGMLFVPSRGGISHSPLEHTDDRLLVQGAQALLDATVELSRGL